MSVPATPGRSTDGLRGLWRLSATRLILGYGALFLLWCIVLIGAINWETAHYLGSVVDQILQQRVHFLDSVERERLPELLAATTALDRQGVMSYGLFDAHNHYLIGDIDGLPAELPVDGQVHSLPDGVRRLNGTHGVRTRGIALRRRSDDLVLVLVRQYDAVDRVGSIIRGGLLWGISLTLIPGLLGGYLLARGPLRRVRGIEAAIDPIMRGNLGARLPVSSRHDELDTLAAIVNRMLEQIERLLGEVKGVSDSIAHDLRTPLTRLRAQLHRLQREMPAGERGQAILERCVADTDGLLERFRALLRISELEDLHRRAGFADVDLNEILGRAHELYAPVAEDRSVAFPLRLGTIPHVFADGSLLFEAVTNLISNAIKFTPGGGTIVLSSIPSQRGPVIEITDTGSGIPEEDRHAVTQRFYKVPRSEQPPGYGLGLSIVAAIVRLHGFSLTIDANEPRGTRVTLHCYATSA